MLLQIVLHGLHNHFGQLVHFPQRLLPRPASPTPISKIAILFKQLYHWSEGGYICLASLHLILGIGVLWLLVTCCFWLRAIRCRASCLIRLLGGDHKLWLFCFQLNCNVIQGEPGISHDAKANFTFRQLGPKQVFFEVLPSTFHAHCSLPHHSLLPMQSAMGKVGDTPCRQEVVHQLHADLPCSLRPAFVPALMSNLFGSYCLRSPTA